MANTKTIPESEAHEFTWKRDAVVSEQIIDHRRWYVVKRFVVKDEAGELWAFELHVPATESQESMGLDVTLTRVKAVEKTVLVYEAVSDDA